MKILLKIMQILIIQHHLVEKNPRQQNPKENLKKNQKQKENLKFKK